MQVTQNIRDLDPFTKYAHHADVPNTLFLLEQEPIMMTNRPLQIIYTFLLIAPLSCLAAENGSSSYTPGFYGDFGMAVAPAPGNYVSSFMGYNTSGDDGNGSNMLFELPGVIRVTETKIAGGNYWVGFFPNVLYTDSVSSTAGGSKNRASRGGAGDMYALPIALSWQWHELSILAFEGVVLPTGSFEKTRGLNSGRNYWTSDTNLGLTWLPKGTNFDLSVMLGYMVNSENLATHYRTGDELHFDFMGGYYLTPQFGLGIAGSYYRQVTPDTGSGVPANLALAEYNSIGPALMYTVKMGQKDVMFSVKWLHEYNVNNHIPGDYAIFRTIFQF